MRSDLPEDVMRLAAETCVEHEYSAKNADATWSSVCLAIAEGIMADRAARILSCLIDKPEAGEGTSPQSKLRGAADAYVAEQGIEHSGGIVERAFEAGALWVLKADADEEMYEIGRRDGFEEAVQEIDQKTGGDGEYRVSMLIGGGVHDERHTPDAPAMIQRIVDRFEVLNLLDDATKDGRDQPDDAPADTDAAQMQEVALARATAREDLFPVMSSRIKAEREQARHKAFEEAAEIAEEFHFMKDIEWWLNSTKKEISAETCLLLAAAIRQRAEEEGR
ncbi:hypothetical protein KNLIENLN_00012 [Sinorhizobium phage NV1.1.1]|nr:hypothetical protein KNLIENLN_00012 [Sinorhizobium phage NV1.1.1]